MTEPELRGLLHRLLRRREAIEVVNRLTAFALSVAGLYLLLLLAVLLLGLSLLGFHLGLYLGLSLFPFFLLLPAGPQRLRRDLRRLDEDCLLEAYLDAAAETHRAFMREAVGRLLERHRARRVPPFALRRSNRRLALVCGGLFLVFQGASYLTLFDVQPSLSARALRNRLAEKATAAAAAVSGLEPKAEDFPPAPRSGAAEPGEEAASLPGREPGPEEQLQQQPGSPRGVREAGGERPAEAPASGRRRERILLPVEPEADGSPALSEIDVPGQLGPDGERELSQAGAGDTGRSFVESPLREYRGMPRRVEVPGGQELAAAASLAEQQPDPEMSALIGEFAAPLPVGADLDPLLEQIRARYLELLDERF